MTAWEPIEKKKSLPVDNIGLDIDSSPRGEAGSEDEGRLRQGHPWAGAVVRLHSKFVLPEHRTQGGRLLHPGPVPYAGSTL